MARSAALLLLLSQVLLLAGAVPVAHAASKPAVVKAVAAKATPPGVAGALEGARAAAVAKRLGAATPTDPSVTPTVEEVQFAIKDWSKFAAAFPRFISKIPEAIQRGKQLAAQPIPATPTDPIIGACVPFRPPAPYKTMQEYAKVVSNWPWRKVDKMFLEAKAYEGGLGVRGCCAGVISGDNLWGTLGRLTPLADSWSGKCIDEDADGKPYKLTNGLFPFGVNRRDWISGRVPSDKMGEALVSKGASWRDGQPAWTLDYTISKEIYGFDFTSIRDEVRLVEPGFAIGTVYARGSNATYTSAFNPSNSALQLIFFALFQTCASDGNYPTQPIDRVYV
jgi:hypothetical protein